MRGIDMAIIEDNQAALRIGADFRKMSETSLYSKPHPIQVIA
jgi:hypothetical protein